MSELGFDEEDFKKFYFQQINFEAILPYAAIAGNIDLCRFAIDEIGADIFCDLFDENSSPLLLNITEGSLDNENATLACAQYL